LPPSYGETNQSYPVLWVTDGHGLFTTAVEFVTACAGKHVPPMIVIGIGAPPEEINEAQVRRTYDFTPNGVERFGGFGGALADAQLKLYEEELRAKGEPVPKELGGAHDFLSFLVDTARPALAQDFRMSGDHTLFGHSGGGLFCTYALLRRPTAFGRYVCGSPSLHGGDAELFRLEERYARTHQDLEAAVFFGVGEAEVLEGARVSAFGIVSSTARMAEILRMRQYPSLRLHVRIFPEATHWSAMTLNLSWGLRLVWQSDANPKKVSCAR
jgi:uncharacterized protein